MDQQITSGLWMAPTVCVLEHPQLVPNHHPLHLQSPPQAHIITSPAQGGFIHPQLISTAHPQNILTIPQFHPAFDGGAKPSIHIQRHVAPLMARQQLNIATTEIPLSITPPNQPLFPLQKSSAAMNFAKVVKRKRISPSAKRRSRLRLIAFLESKRKQQEDENGDANSSNLSPDEKQVQDSLLPPTSDEESPQQNNESTETKESDINNNCST